MPKIKDQNPGFLKVFLYKLHGLRVLTPLTHAHILEDFCGYNTVIQYLESSADFSLKRSVDLIYKESPQYQNLGFFWISSNATYFSCLI